MQYYFFNEIFRYLGMSVVSIVSLVLQATKKLWMYQFDLAFYLCYHLKNLLKHFPNTKDMVLFQNLSLTLFVYKKLLVAW